MNHSCMRHPTRPRRGRPPFTAGPVVVLAALTLAALLPWVARTLGRLRRRARRRLLLAVPGEPAPPGGHPPPESQTARR